MPVFYLIKMGKKDSKGLESKSPAVKMTPENQRAIARQVRELVEPICASEGMELVHVEFQREPGGRVMRLYIDRPEGVNLDDCVRISRQVDDLLEVRLADIGPYHLEVSSPGSNRPLGTRADYDRFAGHKAKINHKPAGEKTRSVQGRLLGLSDETVRLQVGPKVVAIPLAEISGARLVDYHGESR